jgi:hypothetical protein
MAYEYMQEFPESVRQMVGSVYAMLQEGGESGKEISNLLPNATNPSGQESASC